MTTELATARSATTSAAKPSVMRHAQKYALVGVWALVIIVFGVLRPDSFLTGANFSTIFGSQAVLAVLALALLLPLAVGEYDLSVAGVLGLSLILTHFLTAEAGWPLWAAVVTALVSGVAIGVINALLIVAVGVESLVVTLGIGFMLVGVGYAVTPATVVGTSGSLSAAMRTQVVGLPLVFFYGLAIVLLLAYVFSRTPLGTYMFFVGENRSVARLSGIRVNAIRAGALIACSSLSAIAGVFLAGQLGSSSPTVAQDYLLPAFAAVFLGATTITPGRFNPWGTFIAVYFLITGITGLQMMGLVDWVSQVFYGASLAVAVTLSRIAGAKSSRD
ncbi:ABC transporter permease [Pseudonocardia sp.]|uniref:ABC transporter permease n=1 Tax=Pseudonocardia sp. TaxID=60912 RepID=UPI003D0ABE5B